MSCNCKDKIKIKYLDTYPHELKPALEGDAGIDIYASEDITIGAFETVLVPTGLRLEIPKGYEVQVRPKSGLSSKGIKVDLGTIDSGYRGEVMVSMCNMHYPDLFHTMKSIIKMSNTMADKYQQNHQAIKKGQKIAQLVIAKLIPTDFIAVEEITEDTDRGNGGFGSTGK